MKSRVLLWVGLLFSSPLLAVSLQWDAPVDATGVDGYEVHYGAETPQYTDMVDVPGVATTTAVAPTPTAGQTFYYAVRSRNDDGSLVSAFSNVVSYTAEGSVVLSPPGNLTVTPDPIDTPLAEYLFEGDTFDSSGNGLDGVLVGASFVEGYENTGVQFDSDADRIDLGTVDVSGEALTLAAWVYVNEYTTDGRIISKATGTQAADHWWMLSTTTDGSFRLRLKTSGVTTTLVSPGGLVPLGDWVHLMAVYDGLSMRLFLNGTEVAQVAKTGAIDEDAAVPVAIGAQPQGVYGVKAILDNVLIYNQAISPW